MRRSRFNFDRRKLYIILGVVLIFVFSLTIVYAALSVTLSITGNTQISSAGWKIYLRNPVVKSGSSTTAVPTIFDNTNASFSTVLSKPGDFYEFTIDVVNDGGIDAVIDSVVKTSNLTSEQTKYLKFEISYEDGTSISEKQSLPKNSVIKLKVRVEYRTDLVASDLPSTTSSVNLSFKLVYVQSNSDELLDPDSRPQVDSNTVITVKGYTFNVPAGISIYDAIVNYKPKNSYLNVLSYCVTDSETSEVLLDENGKVVNLMLAIVEQGKTYNFIRYNTTASAPGDLLNGDYATVFVHQSIKLEEVSSEVIDFSMPIFANKNDVYSDVVHAVFPYAYFLVGTPEIAGMVHEVFFDYILGYPAGQDLGCAGVTNEHVFFGFSDLNGVPIQMNQKVQHLDEVIAYSFIVSHDEATFEEAKEMAISYMMGLLS